MPDDKSMLWFVFAVMFIQVAWVLCAWGCYRAGYSAGLQAGLGMHVPDREHSIVVPRGMSSTEVQL